MGGGGGGVEPDRMEGGSYLELEAYLRGVPTDPARLREYERLADRYRAASRLVKKLNHVLKILSTFGLGLCAAWLPFFLRDPARLVFTFDIFVNLFIASALVKMFLVLVDLETRFVQVVTIVAATGLVVWAGAPNVGVPIGVGLFYLGMVLASAAS